MLKYSLFFVLTAVLGLFSVVAPAAILSLKSCNQGWSIPFFSVGIEGFSVLTLGFMTLAGFVPGFVFQKKYLLWGLASVCSFPLILLLEVILDSTSHSLWPIEIFVYVFLAVVAVSGSILGSLAKTVRNIRKESKKESGKKQ